MQKCTQILKIIPQTLFDLSLIYLSSSLSTFKMQTNMYQFSLYVILLFFWMYMCTCLYIRAHVWGHTHVYRYVYRSRILWSVSQAIEIKTATMPAQLRCGFWACELWSLYFYGKGFNNWAISPAPIDLITIAIAWGFLLPFLCWLSIYSIYEHVSHKTFYTQSRSFEYCF